MSACVTHINTDTSITQRNSYTHHLSTAGTLFRGEKQNAKEEKHTESEDSVNAYRIGSLSLENEENPWMAHSDMFQSLSFIRILKIQCALHKLKFIFNVECKGGHEAETCYKAKHRSGKSFSAWQT